MAIVSSSGEGKLGQGVPGREGLGMGYKVAPLVVGPSKVAIIPVFEPFSFERSSVFSILFYKKS